MIRRKDYVNSIVYYFNVCRIWKIDPVCFQGILGDLKSFTYDHYLPFVSGLVYIALILLVIAGIVSVVKSLT